jgi:hypothetical protein
MTFKNLPFAPRFIDGWRLKMCFRSRAQGCLNRACLAIGNVCLGSQPVAQFKEPPRRFVEGSSCGCNRSNCKKLVITEVGVKKLIEGMRHFEDHLLRE